MKYLVIFFTMIFNIIIYLLAFCAMFIWKMKVIPYGYIFSKIEVTKELKEITPLGKADKPRYYYKEKDVVVPFTILTHIIHLNKTL